MKVTLYPLYAIASWLVLISAFFLAPVTPLFVNKAPGRLPWWLNWYQMPDNPLWGDASWHRKYPDRSWYWLCVSYQLRNPAQGFDQAIAAKVTMQTPCKVRGNVLSGNYLITGGGYFHLSYKFGFITGGMGWRLNNIVQGYEHKTMGQLVSTILRFHK